MLSCESVSAQWYIFPGKKKKAPKTEQVRAETPAADTVAVLTEEVPTDTVETFPDIWQPVFPDTWKVTLILPLQASSEKPNSNFLEMYGGALMALKEAGAGRDIELTVLDESDRTTPVTESLLEESHLVIGPVKYSNISNALMLNPEGRFIVSPLEPKAAALADSCRVIQAPSTWKRQTDDLVSWLYEDTGLLDEVIVLRDSVHGAAGEQSAYLISKIKEKGIKFRTEQRTYELNPSKTGTTRILIASDRDSYINGAVRDLSVLASQKQSDIVLYANPKVRGSLGVDIEHLHNLRTHYTGGYFIDYDDPATKEFIISYREFFHTEPGQFAFQGYDTMHYFLGILLKYGTEWNKKLPEYSERGLQTSYHFVDSDTVGKVNEAVRRVILEKDSSSTSVK